MEMSALFTLNELDRSIGDFRVGLAVQRHPDRKTARGVFSNDLNAGNGVTSRPLPNRTVPEQTPTFGDSNVA